MIQQSKAIKLLISLLFILSFAPIVASAAPFAYITNYGDNNVSVIDTSTNLVTATVTVGTNPYSVAVNPAGTHVYVANRGSADVSVIDTLTNTVTDTVRVETNPCGVAVNPEGTLVYVANSGSNSVSVIDTSNNTVTDTVTVGTNPYGVAVNPEGTLVYVANRGSNSASVIDTSTNTVTTTVTVGSSPYGVAVNPAGTLVYVSNYGSNSVSVIDTSTNTVTATVTVGSSPRGVAVNPAGTHVYVANFGSNSVSVIDTSTNTVTDTVTVGTSPFGVAVNPAGTHVYVANYNSNNVSVIDTSTNTVTDTVAVGTYPTDVGSFIGHYPEFVNITIDGNKSIIFANHSDSITEGNWISLSGGDPIELPSPFTITYNGTNFSSSSNGRINVTVDVENNKDHVVTYPHTTHDMFTNVYGKNSVSMYFNGTTYFANKPTDVYLIKMSKTSLKDAFNKITDGDITGFQSLLYYSDKTIGSLDVNGDMNLNFGEVNAGNYAIFILLNNSDFNNISILSTTTFQVLDYDSTTTVPSEVIRGNTFNANITLTDAPTDTYKYVGALVHESTYYAEMQLKFNGTRAGTNLTLNDVDIIQGYEVLGVGFSSVNITTILDTISGGIDPINGSVMNTTSETNNASIAFDTGNLSAGNYILLTEVFNSGDLVAFSQSEILISDTPTPTPTPTITSNGGGGSSGGGSTGEEFENILISEVEREMVYMNSKVSYSFDMEGNIVRYINFTGLTSAGRVAAKVEILNHTSALVEHAPVDIVYKNLNIFIGNLGWATSKNIANPTVQFEVEKSWVSENSIDISAITLNRYYDGKWNPVLTTMIGECPDYLYFESQPPGFSPFAVTGKTIGGAKVTPTETGVSPDAGTATPTPTPTEEKPGIPGFEAIGALGMITVVYCMYRRRV